LGLFNWRGPDRQSNAHKHGGGACRRKGEVGTFLPDWETERVGGEKLLTVRKKTHTRAGRGDFLGRGGKLLWGAWRAGGEISDGY